MTKRLKPPAGMMLAYEDDGSPLLSILIEDAELDQYRVEFGYDGEFKLMYDEYSYVTMDRGMCKQLLRASKMAQKFYDKWLASADGIDWWERQQ
jgi:hypothetical protein